MQQIKRIAIMTSGGDAPGMNAFIRGSVRYGLEKGIEVYGIEEGYKGLINNDIYPMEFDSVCDIIHKGGTMLKTARSKEFMTLEGREKAARNLEALEIDALICCGGNGSYAGLYSFANPEDGVWKGQVIGVPGTIDNDIRGTDFTIGFDTAVNTAVEAIDRLRDTGAAHGRHFIVEVMGRHCGDIALAVGIASGATYVAIPETKTDIDAIVATIKKTGHDIIIIAEGDEVGGANQLAEILKPHLEAITTEENNPEFRVCILGHIQRGGRPSARDRVLAHEMATTAVDAILTGKSLKAVSIKSGQISLDSDLVEKTKQVKIPA